MKKLFFTAAFAFCICMGVTAQVNTPATPKPSNADIKFEKNSHDYGTVKYGAD
ncbi:MAG: hypothetical protein IAF38_21615, partial [Bacteroidia bacterium]|nr:hypothetical protein [Bacteroidia bacterium]